MKRWLRAAVCIAAMGLSQAVRADTPPLFGTREIRSGDLRAFPKWVGMLRRTAAERGALNAPCTPSAFNHCYLLMWGKYLRALGTVPLRERLSSVNTRMNRWRYITDPVNWGVDDYWESPLQFFTRNGDCEDYAISKFLSLRAAGVPGDRLRIVVLNDMNLGVLHAVLVVLEGGRWWVLDNQISQVIPADQVRHYRPVYSINETGWWLHTR